MKSKAILMTLAMMSASLAGCTGSDGVTEIDDETLQQLFDDNIQDFMNNTSVTVNQEINYHNNTTVNNYEESNEYSNTTNVEGGEVVNNYEDNDYSETSYNLGSDGVSFGEGVNGTSSGNGLMFVAHLNFTAMDLFPGYEAPGNPQDNSFTYDYGYYDYLTNAYRNDTFSFPCSVYYVVGSQSPNGTNGSSNQVSYWQDTSNYLNAWEQMYNSTVAQLFHEAALTPTIRSVCEGAFATPLVVASDYVYFEFLSIEIPVGYAIEYIQYNGMHVYYGCPDYLSNAIYYHCDEADEYYTNYNSNFWDYDDGPNPASPSELYGGWENTSVEFSISIRASYGSCYEGGSDNYNYIGDCDRDWGSYSIWPTSEYDFTLYYRFVPVIPVV